MLICKKCGGEEFIRKGLDIHGKKRHKCKECGSQAWPIEIDIESNADTEIVKRSVLLAKQKQKLQDINRVERKSFRKHARVENAFEEYLKNLCELLDNKSPRISVKHDTVDSANSMIIQLSDTHFNELVDLGGDANKYDFKIASKRLFNFAGKIIKYIKANNIKSVFLTMTGDLINSDRRIDELMNMATNRAKATLLAFDLICDFIMDINAHANVTIISVSGNESRIREEYTNSNFFATDNFDFMIYELLKRYLKHNDGIKFIDGSNQEFILGLNGINFLITHGNFLGKQMKNVDVAKTITRFIQGKDIKIDYIICGHIHETKITDSLLRSGSLVGANDYSDKGLNLTSKASQNIYLIYSNGYVDTMRIDLQKVNDDDEMYDIDEILEEYNVKSLNKIKNSVENILIYKTIV